MLDRVLTHTLNLYPLRWKEGAFFGNMTEWTRMSTSFVFHVDIEYIHVHEQLFLQRKEQLAMFCLFVCLNH